MITIDGASGEGGGQILRSALSLAAITRTPFHIHGIRARRKNPGLQMQHLAAVQAAAEICGGETQGAKLGSQSLEFIPGQVRGGNYRFQVKTAGSATLVLQTVLLPLTTASDPSQLVVSGGTHNPLAPSFDFLSLTFLPVLARMGVEVACRQTRFGFYPRGGGEITCSLLPIAKLKPLRLDVRRPIMHRRATAVVAGLKRQIAERELDILTRYLDWPRDAMRVVEAPADQGPGNVVWAEVATDEVTEVFSRCGQKGTPAETIALELAAEVNAFLSGSAPVGEHLADQLLLPLALARSGSFTTPFLSSHATTNMSVIKRFLDVGFRTTSDLAGNQRIEL